MVKKQNIIAMVGLVAVSFLSLTMIAMDNKPGLNQMVARVAREDRDPMVTTRLAFLMAQNGRLGADSSAAMLSSWLFQEIFLYTQEKSIDVFNEDMSPLHVSMGYAPGSEVVWDGVIGVKISPQTGRQHVNFNLGALALVVRDGQNGPLIGTVNLSQNQVKNMISLYVSRRHIRMTVDYRGSEILPYI